MGSTGAVLDAMGRKSKALGSFKDGGTVSKTGIYKLHEGETVMADEQAKATLTQIRGQQAAKMSHEDAKKYVADSAKMDKDYEGTAAETDRTANQQQRQAILGSFKQGGVVPKTGNYKLHKGEQVIATDPRHSYQSTLRSKADILDKSGDTSSKAAQFRAKASAQDQYEAHGANGNMIRRGSSVRAPHDKD